MTRQIILRNIFNFPFYLSLLFDKLLQCHIRDSFSRFYVFTRKIILTINILIYLCVQNNSFMLIIVKTYTYLNIKIKSA